MNHIRWYAILGNDIPQHRLLSRLEWDRLRKGEIKQFTYYAITGNAKLAKHKFAVVVHKEDSP